MKRLNLQFCQQIALWKNGLCLSISYGNAKTKMLWQCHQKHQWLATLDNIIRRNSWCPYCKKYDIEFCRQVAKQRNGECLSQEYNNCSKQLFWKCQNGHAWQATLSDIIHHNSWCGICQDISLQKSIDIFIKEADKIHNKYDYSKFTYINAKTKGIIVCKKCGYSFLQTPNNHLRGKGCPKCPCSISRPEIFWLDFLKIKKEYRHKTIKIDGKMFNVDAFDPETNTIYEFYGDYWHGNPKKFQPDKFNKKVKKTFGELYNNTLERERLLKIAGFNIIFIWELDFKLIYKPA